MAEAVADRFEALLRARMERLRVGDPLDKSTDMGAIVHPLQLQRIRDLVARGAAEGAVLHHGEAPEGCFYPPMLVTNVEPASVLSTEEIFGPVVTMNTFRTPSDAVELANNTRYGLAASIWSENVNLCLDVAAQVKAGVVWINCTNVFDAGAGFGGYRETGFGREGGREGMMAYLRHPAPKGDAADLLAPEAAPHEGGAATGIDRTAKLYVGGKQTRPDSGYSYRVFGGKRPVGLAGLGNRKDIRNAVEAAGRPPAGARRRATTARRCSTTSPRFSRPERRSSPSASCSSGQTAARPPPRSKPQFAAASGMPRRPTSSTGRCTRRSRRT